MLKFVNIKEQSASTQIYTYHILALPTCWVASLFHTPTCDLLKILQITQQMAVIKSFFIELDRLEIFGQHAKSCKNQSLTFLSPRKYKIDRP